MYIAGCIISTLYQKPHIKKNEQGEGLQELFESLKSTVPENSFIQAGSRGGLVTPRDNLMRIVEEAKICFRNTVGDREIVLRYILIELICESTINSPVVKSLSENIALQSGTDDKNPVQKLRFESIIKLYLQVSSCWYAKDYISQYVVLSQIRENKTKSKSLRKDLKRSKD